MILYGTIKIKMTATEQICKIYCNIMQAIACIPFFYEGYCYLTFIFAKDIQSSESDSFVLIRLIYKLESIHNLDLIMNETYYCYAFYQQLIH